MFGKNIILHVTSILTIIFIALSLLASKLPFHMLPFSFFSFYLLLFTGYLISKLAFPDMSFIVRSATSFVFGLFAGYVFLLVSAVFKFDCTFIKFAIPVLNILTASILHTARKQAKKSRGAKSPLEIGLSKTQWLIVVSLLTFIIITILASRDPFIYTSDSNDQVSYIRTVARTHETFPENFYYKDGGILTRDLRKSLYHAYWGAIEAITGKRNVHEIWAIVSTYGSVFMIISLIVSMIVIFNNAGIGIIAAFLFVLLYNGGLSGYQLITIAYGYPFGKPSYMLFIAFALRFLKDNRPEFATIAVVSLTVAAWTHIGHLIIGFFTLFCFTLFLSLYKEFSHRRIETLTSSLKLFALSLSLSIPYLMLRYMRDYHPNNIIHTHVQGILKLGENLYTINPVVFFGSLGYPGIASFICLFLFTRNQRRDVSLRLLMHTLIAVYILVFNPFWVPLLASKLTYLLLRFEFAVPGFILPSYLLFSLFSGDRKMNFSGHRARHLFGWLTVFALILAPSINTTRNFAYSPGKISSRRMEGSLALRDMFDILNSKLPKGTVIASDPITSYTIPAFTDMYVVCPFDQHATPNDSTALERIADCRHLYDPYSSIEKIKEVMNTYGAECLVLNGRIPGNIQTMFWKPTRKTALTSIKNLKRVESGFQLLYEKSNLAIFKISDESPVGSTATVAHPPPYVGDSLSLEEIQKCIDSGIEGVLIKSVRFSKDTAERGDKVEVVIEWVAVEKVPVRGYVAYLRFDTDYEKKSFFVKAMAKPYRKILEKLHGERYRFRIDIQPLEGIAPPYSWPLRRKVTDMHEFQIPVDIAPGVYRISLKLDEKTQYPNYSLSDIFSDDDRYSGKKAGELVIE